MEKYLTDQFVKHESELQGKLVFFTDRSYKQLLKLTLETLGFDLEYEHRDIDQESIISCMWGEYWVGTEVLIFCIYEKNQHNFKNFKAYYTKVNYGSCSANDTLIKAQEVTDNFIRSNDLLKIARHMIKNAILIHDQAHRVGSEKGRSTDKSPGQSGLEG